MPDSGADRAGAGAGPLMQYRGEIHGRDYYRCLGCNRNYCVLPGHPSPVCTCGIIAKMDPSQPLVGSALKEIISGWGFKPCAKCNEFAHKMDLLGLDWCENNRPTIISHLQQQSRNRIWWTPPGWSFNRLIDQAIKRAKDHAKKHNHTTDTTTTTDA